MNKSKKIIPILIVVFVFGIYFVGKNIKFENNIFKVKHLSAITDVVDPNLKECITSAVTSAGGDPSAVTELSCSDKAVYTLDGIDYLPNLTKLTLNNNNITNINPVKNLSSLKQLYLNNNLIKSFSLDSLYLDNLEVKNNYISDFDDLAIPTVIKSLFLDGNKISGEIDLSDYVSLNSVGFSDNRITSLTLAPNSFVVLDVSNNDISSIDDITISGTSIADGENGISNSIKNLGISGIPWDASVEQLIINNNATLESISVQNSGLKDTNFFKNQAGGLTNLNTLDLGFNNLNINGVDLRGLNITTFKCDSCGLDQALNQKLNTSTIQNLIIPNNKYTAFYAEDYPNLVKLNVAGNRIVVYTNKNINLKEIDLSHNPEGFGPYLKYYFSSNSGEEGGIENFSHVEKLYLRNINLEGDMDFSKLTGLKELYLDNCSRENPNNINRVILKGSIEVLDVSNNTNFSGITIPEEEAVNGQEPEIPKLENLRSVSMNFTGIDQFKIYTEDHNDPPQKVVIYPSLKEISVIGCKGLQANDTTNDLDLDLIINQITKLSIALSGLGSGYRIPSSTSLRELVVDSSTPNTMIVQKTFFPHLTLIRATSYDKKSVLTSRSSVSTEYVANLAPSYISSPDYEELYGYFTEVDYRKVNRIESTTDAAHYKAKYATITNLYGFTGHTAYDGYYQMDIVKVQSSIYSFDDENMIIFIGDASEDEILDYITLPEGASASVEEGKLIIMNSEGVEVGRYTISHANPVNPGNDDPIDPDTPSGHQSLDPTNPSGDNGNYGTIENPDTGTIISFIIVVLLIASGVVAYYYMKFKKNNEELIEKI